MDQVKYRNFFRSIAENHKQIENDPAKDENFFEVIRSFNPVDLVWDSDFLAGIRSRMKLKTGKCVMVLEGLESKWVDRGGDNRELVPSAAFVILKKTNVATNRAEPAEVSQCLADTQAVCEQIMAYVEEHNTRAWHAGNMLNSLYVELNECGFFPVGPIESNIFGTRCEFTFKTPKNESIIYDEQWWNVPL